MTRCTETCSEFTSCPLSQFRLAAQSADDRRMAIEASKKVPWYVVIGWTVFAVVYVTYQLSYLLPDLRALIAAAS